MIDAIVCFEVLEHDPNAIVETIFDHLNPNGTLILSVPNSHPDSVRLRLVKENMAITNPTHKMDFEIESLMEMFKPHFETVSPFSQKPVGVTNYEEYVKKRRSILSISDFTMDSEDFLNSEVRFTSLKKSFPEEAAELFKSAEVNAKWRYESYKRMAALDYSKE